LSENHDKPSNHHLNDMNTLDKPGSNIANINDNDEPTTLIEVARTAGVSPSTVSRILNGTAKVSDEKRQAVMDAIAKTNFAPNQMAQGLKKGKSMTIGIVVQDISSPFFDETLHGVDDALKGTGYASVIVSGHWDAAEEIERIRLLLARKVDGIILYQAASRMNRYCNLPNIDR